MNRAHRCNSTGVRQLGRHLLLDIQWQLAQHFQIHPTWRQACCNPVVYMAYLRLSSYVMHCFGAKMQQLSLYVVVNVEFASLVLLMHAAGWRTIVLTS